MLNSTVLEIAIGLIFCFASVALVASSVNEAIASLFTLRANSLLKGVKDMLNDDTFKGLANKVYNDALVNPLNVGTAKTESELQYKPSYIDSKQFAQALLNAVRVTPIAQSAAPEAVALAPDTIPRVPTQATLASGAATSGQDTGQLPLDNIETVLDQVQTATASFSALGTDINMIPDEQLRRLLQGIYRRANGDIDSVRRELANWFDSAMERASGEYKRRTQFFCFVIAFLFATMFNIDAVRLFQTLWEHPALAAAVNSVNAQQLGATLNDLQKLPVGWPSPSTATSFGWLTMLVGWLVTASSALFGAPFWFDLLQRAVQLRGTGKSPDEIAKGK